MAPQGSFSGWERVEDNGVFLSLFFEFMNVEARPFSLVPFAPQQQNEKGIRDQQPS